MLTRVLFAFALVCGTAAAASAGDPKVLALGITDHQVSQEELEKGEALPAPKFNTPAVAYGLVADVLAGDTVEVRLAKDGSSLLHNTQTLEEDQSTFLLHAGKLGVPAGGWPQGSYAAEVEISRDGKKILSETSTPIVLE